MTTQELRDRPVTVCLSKGVGGVVSIDRPVDLSLNCRHARDSFFGIFLRERIAKISSSIAHQETLLKKLRGDRSLLQRQLNEAVDPVARLPLEISSEIFLRCLDPFPSPGASYAPTLLLNVCNTWTRIALSTPALWAAIYIELPCTQPWERALPSWSLRAHNRPLSVSLGGNLRYLTDQVSSCVWKHASRLKHLEISDDKDEEMYVAGQFTIRLLKDTPPPFLPLLETLTVRCSIADRVSLGPQIIQLLRRAPNIIECFFDSVDFLDFDDPKKLLLLPTLRRLDFADGTDDDFLNYLSLPALQTLTLSMCIVSFNDVLRFLKRSVPPLEELTMSWRDPDFTLLHECLDVIPTLSRLELSAGTNSQVVDNLCAAVANSPSLLPNLHTLTVHIYGTSSNDIPHSFWGTLLRAVSTRRIDLRLFGGFTAPPDEVLVPFRQLAMDGIQIHIGCEESNLVAV
ncbi:hypothetical protein C8R45DRAFT_1161503 [Mycena sanguinolenta]|nr:hypothetical protein C8R45DRAFT_1161503 [Mycena sanguinolenta]